MKDVCDHLEKENTLVIWKQVILKTESSVLRLTNKVLYRVQKFSSMRNNNECFRPFHKVGFQPENSMKIKMVLWKEKMTK